MMTRSGIQTTQAHQRGTHTENEFDNEFDNDAGNDEDNDASKQTSQFISTRNPLATAYPSNFDRSGADAMVTAIHLIPDEFKTKNFSVTTTAVCANEMLLSINGLRDITLDEWNKLIPSTARSGKTMSFDRICIHIPFHSERRKKRCRMWIVIAIAMCVIALTTVAILLLKK